jgi:putative mRNA 3-end processing factor
MHPAPLLVARPEGLYCAAGDFYIDPWRPVDRAVLTHAHSDHARPGHVRYLAAAAGAAILRERLGDISLQTLAYGERLRVGDAWLSLHPAGHVLGSAQIRIEAAGETWVVSGDYKLAPDPTCAPFEPIACDVFVTESTFGLPIYRWQPPQAILDEIRGWWFENAALGRCSLLFCYALGKAQRILAGLDAELGPILTHGAVERLNQVYRAAEVVLPSTLHATDIRDKALLNRALVLAPPSAANTPWLRRFGDYSPGFASGWMQVRGARRQRRIERGFVLSDHADWPGLLTAIRATGAGRILVTHGRADALVRYLRESGLDAHALDLDYGEEDAAAQEAPAAS